MYQGIRAWERESGSNDLMKIYISPGIGKLLLLGEHGWGKEEKYSSISKFHGE